MLDHSIRRVSNMETVTVCEEENGCKHDSNIEDRKCPGGLDKN